MISDSYSSLTGNSPKVIVFYYFAFVGQLAHFVNINQEFEKCKKNMNLLFP